MGENEIRIHLSEEDLDSFSITPDEFDYDSTKCRKIIWELFDRAKEETGFDAAKEKVYIQLYPKNDGSVELFVTKLEKEKEALDFYSFSDSNSFLSALSLVDLSSDEIHFYRRKETERFFLLAPNHLLPPNLCEYGEKKEMPSPLFFKGACKRLFPNR